MNIQAEYSAIISKDSSSSVQLPTKSKGTHIIHQVVNQDHLERLELSIVLHLETRDPRFGGDFRLISIHH